jgi:hypothetical protein
MVSHWYLAALATLATIVTSLQRARAFPGLKVNLHAATLLLTAAVMSNLHTQNSNLANSGDGHGEVQVPGLPSGAPILVDFWTEWANKLPRAAGNAGPLICKIRGISIGVGN